jgi:hypothetical protein
MPLPKNLSVGKLDEWKEVELNGLSRGVTYIDL